MSIPGRQTNKLPQLNTTHSGKLLKNEKNQYSNSEIQSRFGKQNEKQRAITRDLLRKGELEI